MHEVVFIASGRRHRASDTCCGDRGVMGVRRFLMIALLAIVCAPASTAQQGTTQIVVMGAPPTLPSPYLGDLVRDYRGGIYSAQFIYSSPSSIPVSFRLEIQIDLDGRRVVDVESDPATLEPGVHTYRTLTDDPPFRFGVTDEEFLAALREHLPTTVERGGILPEGAYVLTMRLVPDDPSALIVSVPSVTFFNVALADPPVLFTPPDRSLVNQEYPMFAWTSVFDPNLAGVEYDVRIVAMFDRQTPLQAIESNRPHAEVTVSQNTMPYSPSMLPFEAGRSYAWQVQARDPSAIVPFSDDGLSVIHTFEYDPDASPGPRRAAQIGDIVLEPGFAKITGLSDVRETPGPTSYTLDGPATLELETSPPSRALVDLNRLEIQNVNLQAPVVMGGALSARSAGRIPPPSERVDLQDVQWSMSDGLTVGATFDVPDQPSVRTDGRLRLTAAGFAGTLVAQGSPIMTLGDDLVEARIDQIEASFPSGVITASGSIAVFGGASTCRFEGVRISEDDFEITINCTDSGELELFGSTNPLRLDLGRLRGTVRSDPAAEAGVFYDLALTGELKFSGTQASQDCGVEVGMRLSSADGFSTERSRSTCWASQFVLDLGAFDAILSNVRLEGLQVAAPDVDVSILANVRLESSALPGLDLPEIDDVAIDASGFHFPRLDLAASDFPTVLAVQMLRLAMESFTMPQLVHPYFDWDETGDGPWDYEFRARARWADEESVPVCLRDAEMTAAGIHTPDDQLAVTLSADDVTGCRIPVGSVATIVVDHFSGAMGAYDDPDTTIADSWARVDGRVEWNEPFQCAADETPDPAAEPSEFEFWPAGGGVSGRVTNIHPACPLRAGPFNLQVTDSELVLDGSQREQDATLSGSATLQLESFAVDGTFALDVVTGEFTELSFALNRPFTWSLPPEDPVLTFSVDGASVSADGFLVDGVGQLLVDDEEVGVEFDSFLVDIETGAISRGSASIEGEFTLEAGIDDETNALSFLSRPADAAPSIDPGFLVHLSPGVTIDSTGMQAAGLFEGELTYGGEEYTSDFAVLLSNDFAVGFAPPRIVTGRADIEWQDTRIAYADADGFHPDISFVADAVLPDRIPLPLESIAYLEIRDGETDLVAMSEEANGVVVINSVGEGPRFVVPALNPADPPVLSEVTLDDVRVRMSNGTPEFISGSVRADAGPDAATAADFPLHVETVAFESRDLESGPQEALFVDGQLVLFGTPVDVDATLAAYADGTLSGVVDVQSAGVEIPLVPDSDAVVLFVDALQGEIGYGPSGVDADLSLESRLAIRADASSANDALLAEAELGLRWDGTHLVVSTFTPSSIPERPSLDLGPFGLRVDSLVAVSDFRHDPNSGWSFGMDLNASFTFAIDGNPDRPLVVPVRSVGVSQAGITVPPQDISRSTISGVNLPAVQMAGLEVKPLALRTASALMFDWTTGMQAAPSPRLDLAILAPALEDYGVFPDDGLTVLDAGFADGTLTGAIEPLDWLDSRRMPVIVGSDAPPYLHVAALSGGLTRGADGSQQFDIRLSGEIDDLPGFDAENCPPVASVELSLVGGLGLEGSVGNVNPCGSIPLGPLSLSFQSAELAFAFTNETQSATLDGTASVEIPAPDESTPPASATGSLQVDILNGAVTSGEIRITDPFTVGLPLLAASAAFPDVCFITAQDGLLNADGLTLNGSGSFGKGEEGATASIQLNDLRLSWEDGNVAAGSATIGAELDLHFGLSPLGFSLVDPTDTPPSDDHVLVDFSNSVTLDADGLSFSGQATADLVFAEQQFASLNVAFENDFTMRLRGFGVTQGRVAMYVPAEPDEPLATIDQNGFSIGGAIVALLPARIGLPTEDIAYVVTRDAQDQTLLDVGDTPNGGHTLSTRAPIDLVIPALDSGDGPPVISVEFDLTSDASYNVQSGSITLASPLDLEPAFGLPVVLNSLGLVSDAAQVELELSVAVDLPDALGDHDLAGDIRLSSTGPTGTLTLGDPDAGPSAQPVSTFTFGDANAGVTVGVNSVVLELDSNPELAVQGSLGSTFLNPDEPTIAWDLAFTSAGSDFDVRLPGEALKVDLGSVSFELAGDDPLTVELTDDRFIVAFDGVVNFEDVLAEPLEVAIQDLEVGVVDVATNPSVHFGIGGAGALGDLHLSLFDGAAELDVRSPGVSADEGGIAITATDGDLIFLDTEISFSNFRMGTDGGFSVDEIEAGDVQLVGEYVVLSSIGLSTASDMRLTASLDVTLPEPVSATAEAEITVRRNSYGAVVVESSDAEFDLNTDIQLGSFGSFRLTAAAVDVDPFDPLDSAVKASGRLRVGDRDVLWFGEASNLNNNPGIEYSNLLGLRYNVTGAVNFEVEHSFFRIAVEADAVASSDSEFSVEFGGSASVMIQGVGGTIGYEGLMVTADGVEDYGNIVAPAQLTLMEFATLEIGRFVQLSNAQIEVPTGFDAEPNELAGRAGSQAPTEMISVSEYLCFGPCGSNTSADALHISLGGQSSNSSGGFSGGVGEIIFYRTPTDETYLLVRDVNMQLDDMLTMSASMEYAQGPDGFALRVVAGGSFDVGNVSAEAALAGTIRNKNGELSFGLFVAARASVGIPIVPGVVELIGVGGGFFYRPTSGDLATVTGPSGALQALGFDLQHTPSASNVKFALMLYAAAGIAGSAGNYAVEGSAFLQITDQSIFLEAQGSVLGFDGEGNLGAEATASFYVEANRNPFLVEAGVAVDIVIPIYLEGHLDIELFIAEVNDRTVWGVLGNGEVGFINNLITASGRFAASNDGFLVQAWLDLGFDLKVISVSTTAEGAIWLLTAPQYEYPFGAYVTFVAEVCVLGGCASVGAEAALVSKRPSGFELFAAVFTKILGKEVRAWAAISENGVRGGLGRGEHGDLIAELKQQADEFIDSIRQIGEDIQQAKADLARAEAEKQVEHGIAPEVVAEAGANFHLMDQAARQDAADDILLNEERHVSNLPNEAMNFVSNFILKPDPSRPELTWAQADVAALDADSRIDEANTVIDDVEPRLAQAAALAVAYTEQSEEMLDGFINALDTSPLTSAPPESFELGSGEQLSFTIDQATATSQASSGEAAAEAAAVADAQVLEAIDAINAYMQEIDDLISFRVQVESVDPADPFEPDTGPAIAIASLQPGVADAMRVYQWAAEASDRYYALAANVGWQTREWAQTRRGELVQRRSGIQAGLGVLYSEASTDAVRRSQSEQRVRHLYDLAESGDLSAELQRHDAAFDQNPQTEYSTVGLQLWYDMHLAGLDTLALASARTSMETMERARVARTDIRRAQAGVAAQSDKVYALRQEMAANLYNLVDGYIALRESAVADDSVTARLNAVRQRLLDELVPPTLAGISVAPNRIGYRNEAQISWTATHPIGVAEVSYDIEREGPTGPANPLSFVSAGNAPNVTLHAVKGGYSRPNSTTPESYHETQSYVVGVRVRGRGGRTAERTASFEIGVGPGSDAPSSDTDIVVTDDSPPASPRILLGEYYGYTTLFDLNTGNTVRRYWTKDGQMLELIVQAYDHESDIQTIVYAVGSQRGGTDVVDWAPLEGNRMRVDGVEGFPVVQIVGQTRILNMSEGTPYYVSVRATNGDGLVSPVTEADAVAYDATPPSTPGAQLFFHTIILPYYTYVPVASLANDVPGYTDYYFTNDNWLSVFQSTPLPEVKAGWQASSDPESGIRRYELDNSFDRDAVDFGPQPRTTTSTQYTYRAAGREPYVYAEMLDNDFTARYTGAVTSYRDTVFVHVRAQNNARAYSDTETMARVPRDPTGPIRPTIAARIDGANLRVYLTSPAYDFESGVAGLQYAAGSSAGSADLQPWTQGIAFPWSNSRSLAENFVPEDPDNCLIACDQTRSSFTIPLKSLPQGVPFYLSMRAVNTQGSWSAPSAAGPITIDTSPPTIGGVTLTDNGDGTLTIRASNVSDPESGIQSVEYRLKDAFDYFNGTPWSSLFTVYGGKSAYSGQRTVSFSGISKTSLRVGVRATNGSGGQTTVWAQFPIQFEF